MTQVQDMTDQQLNRALAEHMGISVRESGGVYQLFKGEERGKWRNEEWKAWVWDGPKYCADPAASLEVQKKAIEVNYAIYIDNLANLFWGHLNGWNNSEYGREEIAYMMTATPRKVAEAAYMTLSQGGSKS